MTPPLRQRRAYIDWIRGAAVVLMIFGHVMDAWTRPADRSSQAYDLVIKLSGMGAPLFLFLAGLSVALSGGAQLRRGTSLQAAGAALRRRGWEILGLGFLFRLQAWLLSPGSTLAGLLKVDILNIMGPAMVVAATLWAWSSGLWSRLIRLSAVAIAFSLLTPFVRESSALAALPDWIEWYLRPPPGRSWFTMFPWAGLLVAGTVMGVCLDRAQRPDAERRVLAWLAVAGGAVFVAALAGARLPSLFSNTHFWTTGPSYYFLRIGLMTLLLPVAWLWCRGRDFSRFSPLLQFGHTSLFVYWIHVEMVYGILSRPWHRALPLGVSFTAFLAFTGLMLLASVGKDRAVARWKTSRTRAEQAPGAVVVSGPADPA
jgi:uncharacterized membrane protein